jgi:hypothetical protein
MEGKKEDTTMKAQTKVIAAALLLILMSVLGWAQTPVRRVPQSDPQSPAQVNASSSAVTGSGTGGRLSKWAGTSGTSTYVLGDSNIFEDKYGKVGIGTTTPTSPLTVQGMIETTLGGYKFPDGTVQTTAGLGSIFTNDTLVGNGTSGSPLGVKVPLILSGSVSNGVIQVTNTQIGNAAIVARASGTFGIGVRGFGGESGSGVDGFGGDGNTSIGGDGVVGIGGDSNTRDGGQGLVGGGGGSFAGNGGSGALVSGGTGSGMGNRGGFGIEAYSGLGVGGAADGLAGKFSGDVEVSGNLAKGGGSFKIDHPLDPENKYLYHSFVESPDMKNIYDGTVTIDANGEAVVQLPEWFEALNDSYRYLLTAIGMPAPGLYVAEKIAHHQFKIAGGVPGMEVSWQVTGVRQDAFAKANRIKVEVDKPERERGYYLHPEALGKPAERGVEWARNPELMRQMKEAATTAQKRKKQ